MVYIPKAPAKAKKSKYGNKRVEYMGKSFDSVGERDRYIFLLDAQRRGLIEGLKCQVSFRLIVNDVLICRYIADFVYVQKIDLGGGYKFNTVDVIEDFKGMKTAVYKLKEKLMLACHGIKIRVVKAPTDPI